jgi:hypothetical protein
VARVPLREDCLNRGFVIGRPEGVRILVNVGRRFFIYQLVLSTDSVEYKSNPGGR